MLSLPTVTFVIVENRWPDRVARLCDHISKHVDNPRIFVKSDLPKASDKSHYDRFCSVQLHEAFTTPHAMVCQLDGYPVHWDSWTDEFLAYDYIGAPWPDSWRLSHRVGNGGLSLRSRRLCLALSQIPFQPMNDDVFVCQHARGELERQGMVFASPALAARFSIEHRCSEHKSVPRPFGFHDARFNPYPSF